MSLAFGVARASITPTMPVGLAGYFTVRMWDHVLDDILVQALAFGHEHAATMVLVQLDLVTPPMDVVAAVRQRCADRHGLAPERLVFCASHTHTAPVVRPGRPGGNPEYNAFLVDRVTETVAAAVADMHPGTLETGLARDDRFAFNRRYWMKDGTVVTNPPRRDPGIDRPEGPIDPCIPLLACCSDGRKQVLIANISNHADTIGGCGVSADWHGFVRRTLEKEHPGLRVITLTGCEGNINHFDPQGDAEQSGYDISRRIGEGYAESIMAAWNDMKPSSSTAVAHLAAEFEVGPREITDDELRQARADAEAYTFDPDKDLTSEDLATRSPAALKYFADHLLQVAADRSNKRFEVHAARLGDAVLVTLPGEPFVEYGLAIREEMPAGTPVLVAALGDGRATYIPNRFNYGRGGYEVTPRCSPYAMATGETMRQTVRDLLDRLPG